MNNHQEPNQSDLNDSIGKIAYSLDKAYLHTMRSDYSVKPFDEYVEHISNGTLEFNSNIRGLQVKRWVYDSDELIRDGFKNILGLFSNDRHNIALIIRRTPTNVEMFMAVKNEFAPGAKRAKTAIALCRNSISGNFPGSLPELLTINDFSQILDFSNTKSVSALCGIPTEKSENYISQGIEKLLNGLVPQSEKESYTCVILAQPLSLVELRSVLCGYEDIATALTPFASKQVQLGRSSSKTEGSSENGTKSLGETDTSTQTHNLGVAVSAGIHFGTPALGGNVSVTGNYGYSWGKSHAESVTNSVTHGTNRSVTDGETASTSYSYKTYSIFDLLSKIEATIQRITESQATGLWRTAAYVFSEDENCSTNAANYLNSIMQGDNSYLEPPFINTWYRSDDHNEYTNAEGKKVAECRDFDSITQYIRHLTHPIFVNKKDRKTEVLHTANVATSELSNLFAFPNSSVPGVPVIKCAAFGREPQSLSKIAGEVRLGNAYHMLKEESGKPIRISKNHLTAHTFITGSTGAGKSNTIYHLLSQTCDDDTHFLVIEPAKGEYKNVFGNRKDVTVYGTNPKLSALLRINPFSFPPEIHIYEHMDRLIEIFNVCWPMYAAMPAVLKDAVERAYKNAGWDLKNSRNKYNDRLFPSFVDVLSEIENVMNESQYSSDSKGDYKGALSTRLKSLTNGLNSLIFCNDELSEEELFDENVIIDLSRVGAVETKSLIMGLLVMKLQEHRMAHAEMNSNLKHLTVLEEAHNLLKRTSTEQSSEGSNMVGKSVEMLTNAIAEMRTYGEGFVIADQAPGLLDEAVIRNTNTKIVLRIPEYSDRVLVGKSIGLTDEQIDELSHLERGVAAVYQNDWIEAVLCKIDEFKAPISGYSYSMPECLKKSYRGMLISKFAQRDLYRLIEHIDDSLIRAELPVKVKCLLYEYVSASESEKESLSAGIAYELFNGTAAFSKLKPGMGFDEQRHILEMHLNDELSPLSREYQEIILNLMVIWHAQKTESAETKELVERIAEHWR